MKPIAEEAKMSNMNQCPECECRLSDSSPVGPCPACLMKLGMNAWQQAAGGPSLVQPTAAPRGSVQSFHGRTTSEEIGVNAQKLEALFPQLEILHLVGQGGMGAVYCARQKSLNRLVALKIVHPDARTRGDFESRFAREARALAQLNHPNIITVHDFGQADDIYYFVMEYVDGINLRQMLLGQKLTPAQALQVVPAICDALQYAHDHGVVHRDIKPENILIDTAGNIKIADFGLAKLLDQESTVNTRLTQDHQVMGTMHYMAPEQIEHPMDVDHRADIYSLGVVIYELLTGELPLGRFAPPSKKVHVDIRLDEIVLQTLEKEPSLRYQKVSHIKSDVQSLGAEAYVNRRAEPQRQFNSAAAAAPVEPAPPVKSYGYAYPVGSPHLNGPLPGLGFWGAWTSSQSYKNALYLLTSFPLGIFYFVLVIVGLSVGISTVIIWIGLFVLVGTFLGVRGAVAFERMTARKVLKANVSIRPRRRIQPDATVIQRAGAMFRQKETWLGIVYLLGKMPLGIVSLVVFVILLTVPLALMASPILLLTPVGGPEIAGKEIDSPVFSSVIACIGLVIGTCGIHISNGMAWVHAAWARLCLGREG